MTDLAQRGQRRPAWLLALAALGYFTVIQTGALAAPEELKSDAKTFATIDGKPILQAEFDEFFAQYMRNKFFHKLPKKRLAAARREAAGVLIERRLLAREAERRGVTSDPAVVERRIAAIESKYGKSDAWPRVQAQIPKIRQRMIELSKIEALEKRIRHVDDPGLDLLVDYHKRNIERFTEPPRDHLAVILIKVPPSAPRAGWEEGERKAQKLHAMLKNGTPFADIAKLHSNHESASSGGDLGFVHRGVLAKPAQKAVDGLGVGELSAPVRVLEGFVIFQLNARKPSEKKSFEEVRDRVLALYLRENSSRKWRRFVAELKKNADVVILDPDATKEK